MLNNGVMTHYYDHFPHATANWKSNELGGNYAETTQSLGAHAERITSPNRIRTALQKAIDVSNTGQSALLEMISKEKENISTYGK